jgi:O-antigen/teichoic acid export membrane protein
LKADTTHRELGRETVLYALAMVVSGMVQLAFLPFISRWLTAPQVGELGVLSTASEVVAAIAILGLPTAVLRAWHESAARRSILVLASVLPLLPLALCAVLAVIAAPGLLGTLHLTSPALLLHALALGGSVALFQAASATARARGMALFFFMLQLCRGLASLGLLLLFMTGFRGMSPLAAFIGARWVPTLAAFGVVVLVMYRHTSDSATVRDPGLTRRLLAFGVPLIPAGLAMIVLSGADIVMLRTICPDLSQSGYYEWASRAALILSPITMGFGMAWQRHIFRKKREGGSLHEMGRTALTFMTCVVWASMVLALSSLEVTLVFGGGAWLPAASVLPWIAASGALYALFTVSRPGPLLTGQTRFIGGMTFFGAVLNIGFNLRLIPVAGAVGAAFATMAANMFMGMSLFWLGRKVFPVSFGAVFPLMALPVAAGIASGLGPGIRSIIVLGVTAVTVLVLMGLKAAGGGDDKP